MQKRSRPAGQAAVSAQSAHLTCRALLSQVDRCPKVHRFTKVPLKLPDAFDALDKTHETQTATYLPSSRPYSPPAASEAVTSRTYGARRAPAANSCVWELTEAFWLLCACADAVSERRGWATHLTTTEPVTRPFDRARRGVPVKARVVSIL